MSIQSDILTLSPMNIDKNGDGVIDATITPKLGGTVIFDTTPPEAKVTFNTSTKKILFTGSDESSTTTLKTSATSTTVTDLAGNTLTFKISQNISQANHRASLTIPSFSYSTGLVANATTSLRYFWATNKSNKYTLFISAIRTPTNRLVSFYSPATNKTYILQSLPTDDTADLSKMTLQLLKRKIVKQVKGMVVPYVATQKGSMIIKY